MKADGRVREALLQMRREFASTVEALEKRAEALAAHNALLAAAQQQQSREIAALTQARERAEAAQQQQQQRADAYSDELASCRDELERRTEELTDCRGELASCQDAYSGMQTHEQSLEHECAALKLLLQQEQDYWRRFETSKQAELERLHVQAAAARADAQQSRERSDSLARELQQLQSRVSTAMRTSRTLEQRLKVLAHQKHDEQRALAADVQRLERKLSDKREQNKYLTQALVAREEEAAVDRRRRRPKEPASEASSSSSVLSEPITDDTVSAALLCQPRAKRRVAAPVSKKQQLGLSRPTDGSVRSHALTSPTASSPDLTPPPSPSAAIARPEATSARDERQYHHHRDPQQLSERRTSARLEREMSDLRRKLDACMHTSP